jgi:hypothetical protein
VKKTSGAAFAPESDLTKLLSWCKKKKLQVIMSPKAENFRDESKIVISSRLSHSTKIVYILHEAGHALIDSTEDCSRFGAGYPSSSTKTFLNRSAIVFEELEAWKRGWDLAKRLKLKVSKGFYNKKRNEAMKLYFKWALSPKEFEL